MRLIDADALIGDLEHDVAIDEDILNYVGTVGAERINTQFDKDCKQNAIDLLLRTPTIDPTVDKDYLVSLIQEAVYDGEACGRLLDLVDRPQGEWIPCSERLPDLEEYVLVTLRYGETMIMALDWDDGKIEWKTQEESIIYDDEEVIAWQPLPEPYMEGADDEDLRSLLGNI